MTVPSTEAHSMTRPSDSTIEQFTEIGEVQPSSPAGSSRAGAFLAGLFLVCASTLVYEILLTRLLSVITWYYLAFIAVSTAMFGVTVGALSVQLFPRFFEGDAVPHRISQAAFALSVAIPLALLNMFAVPLGISMSVETLYTFLLFSLIIAVPFFFAGVVVCLALTRSPFAIGKVYFTDLVGSASGCVLAVVLLKMFDAPSAMFAVSAISFAGAACFRFHARRLSPRREVVCALAMFALAVLNTLTLHGVQPMWVKEGVDRRTHLLTEVWSPLAKIVVYQPVIAEAPMWGPSPNMPPMTMESMELDIDNGAGTSIVRFTGKAADLDFLRYDVTSIGPELRQGGSAAIIGVGGGRDVLAASANGFHRIVGIEVNRDIARLTTVRLDWFSGLSRVPGFELHVDDGRSFLTRSPEKFDLVQASLVDTWAAASAGALTLSESALYTVDAWQIFYRRLKPRGLLTFTRWNSAELDEGMRTFSLGWAVLLSEGVADPSRQIALVGNGRLATILISNEPFSEEDLRRLHAISEEMDFKLLYVPGEESAVPEIRAIMAAQRVNDLARLQSESMLDLSPTSDERPFFFNALRVRNLPTVFRSHLRGETLVGNVLAIAFLLSFLLASLALIATTILAPMWRKARSKHFRDRPSLGGMMYFVAIGIGFMMVEIAMLQQLSILLGHPVYSLVVVLAGLIVLAGLGSLMSERLKLRSRLQSGIPALSAGAAVLVYVLYVVAVVHNAAPLGLGWRIAISLGWIAPSGLLMGMCVPTGMRWMSSIGQRENLAWFWAVNGAASVFASFLAVLVSMEVSLTATALAGAGCYIVAAMALTRGAPQRATEVSS